MEQWGIHAVIFLVIVELLCCSGAPLTVALALGAFYLPLSITTPWVLMFKRVEILCTEWGREAGNSALWDVERLIKLLVLSLWS